VNFAPESSLIPDFDTKMEELRILRRQESGRASAFSKVHFVNPAIWIQTSGSGSHPERRRLLLWSPGSVIMRAEQNAFI
jgi:hypothetical protein